MIFPSALTLIFLLLFLQGCKEEVIHKDAPECVRMKIEWIAQQGVWNPPAKVYSYLYEDKTVFYITPRCCDITSQLYDSDCNLLCYPDGGFTGGVSADCADFFTTRKGELLIWEDERAFP